MDQPRTPMPEFKEALKDIRWVNRHLGGTETLLEQVSCLLEKNPKKAFSVLDLGTGSADIPVALAVWGREQKIELKITALDLHPSAVEDARQVTENYPEIMVVQGDALQTGYPDGSFDVVTSSMFMHHLNDDDAIRLLREMDRLARVGFVVNDLQRHVLAWLGISTLGFLTGKGRVFKNDAPLSVLRGFTVDEIHRLTEEAGFRQARIFTRPPYRVVLVNKKMPVSHG